MYFPFRGSLIHCNCNCVFVVFLLCSLPPPPPLVCGVCVGALVCVNVGAGGLYELMYESDKALSCYSVALKYNPYSFRALVQMATVHRSREEFSEVCLLW